MFTNADQDVNVKGIIKYLASEFRVVCRTILRATEVVKKIY